MLLYQVYISQTRDREVYCPRNRCRGEGQDIDPLLQLLEPLLVSDPEPLFLIDDEEAKVFEDDIGLEEPMGSYHDIDFTTCEGGEERLLLPLRPETREGLDPNRIVGESLPEGMEVLLGEDRRRSEDCDLGAILYCLEGRSDRDLGLPITDIPTDQPVHRPI